MKKEKVLQRWKEYICELFEDNRPPENLVTRREKENLPILKEEIVKAIKSMPKGKAAGPDEVYIELIQALDDLVAEWILMDDKQDLQGRTFSNRYVPICLYYLAKESWYNTM